MFGRCQRTLRRVFVDVQKVSEDAQRVFVDVQKVSEDAQKSVRRCSEGRRGSYGTSFVASMRRISSRAAITLGKLGNLSKPASDTALAGIWKLKEEEQDYYWNINKDGKGTFHTLGASIPVSFTVTEDGKIDGDSYTISDSTLTLSEGTEATFTKVDSVPSGSGFGGDALLHGTWKGTQGDYSLTLVFESDGTLSVEESEGDITFSYSYIWKADGSTFSMYNSAFGSSGSNGMSYTISSSTLTLSSGDNEMVLTKQ